MKFSKFWQLKNLNSMSSFKNFLILYKKIKIKKMGESSKKAEQFVKEANKTVHKLFGFKVDKLNKASDLLTRAGNLYKIDRDFKRAGDCYFLAAKHLEEAGNKTLAIHKSRDATMCYFKCIDQHEKTKETMDYADRLVSDAGDPFRTANLMIEGAKRFQQENEKDLALQAYERALALLKDNPDTNSTAAGVIEEIAYLIGDFDLLKASDLFVEAGKLRLQTQMTQGLGNRLLINAIFCRLAIFDCIGAQQLWKQITSEYSPSLKFSMEGQQIERLVNASISQPEKMAEVIKEYSAQHTVDAWTKDLFHRMAPVPDEPGEEQNKDDDEIELL